MTWVQVLEAVAVGAWLGLTQIKLGFALLSAGGASIGLFFCLVGVWLAGGACGAVGKRCDESRRLLAVAVACVGGSHVLLTALPFSYTSTASGLAAALFTGAYGGRFLRARALRWQTTRSLLLSENNGFILGYASGACLLMSWAPVLDIVVGALGIGLLTFETKARR